MDANKPNDAVGGYALVEDLIHSQVRAFRRRYGGDIDELEGEANLAFVRGHTQYMTGRRNSGKPITINYMTHVRYWVWYSMFDAMRQRLTRYKRTRIDAVEDIDNIACFELDENDVLGRLSPDARYVAGLAVDTPPEMGAVVMAKGGTPRNYRSTIREHLAGVGWTARRINAAFEEIAQCV